jgi:uncharacterized protein GlcG (DUF336 family)
MNTTTTAAVSLRDARRIIEAGEEAARTAGLDVHLVVLDAFGDLVAHARMDGTWGPDAGAGIDAGLVRRAIDLAVVALGLGAGQLQRYFSINHRDLSRRTIVVAAEPLLRNDLVVGAVSISGLSGDSDLAIAPTAAKVLP